MNERPKKIDFETVTGMYNETLENAPVIETLYGNVSLASNVGVGKERNEDRVFLDTNLNLFGVVDGIGGYERGDEAAEIVCQQVIHGVNQGVDPGVLQHKASTSMRSNGILMGGACYLYFQVIKKEIHARWAGDVKLIIFNESGEVTYETKSTDISSAPRGQNSGKVSVDIADFMNHHIAIAASDGLWDNVALDEVRKLVQETRTGETSTLLKKLHDLALVGMREGFMTDYGGMTPDKRKDYGKPDNIGIVVFQKLPKA